jgi:hypothetical protein
MRSKIRNGILSMKSASFSSLNFKDYTFTTPQKSIYSADEHENN